MLRFGPVPARGAATIEFYIVALFALIPMCAGMIQVALLLVANHHVDLAAFAAARAGAVAGGNVTAIRSTFAKSLAPLLVQTEGGIDRGNVANRVLEAQLRAAPQLAIYSRIEVISPGSSEAADFSVTREGSRVIPNDSLEFRSMQVGSRSGRTLQEANVLQIAATWCHPLIVPMASELLLGVLRRIDREPLHQICYVNRRVPIRSRGVAPMQSDFVVVR